MRIRRWIVPAIGAVIVLALAAEALWGENRVAIDLLRLLLGWPVVIGLLLVGFAIWFRDEIGAFLANVGAIKTRWAEIQMQQPAPPEGEPLPTTEDGDAQATDEDNREVIRALQRAVYFWFNRYLSVYLVPHTKQVLLWLSDQTTPIQSVAVWAEWGKVIQSPAEQQAVLTALLENGLVEWTRGMLRITENGRRFVKFMSGHVEEAIEP